MEESKRQKQVGAQVKQDISDILTKEMSGIVQGALVTITDVRMTSDLSLARIYVSIFPFSKAEQGIKTLRENISAMRRELGKRVGKQLRIVPELTFFLDDSLERIGHLEELIKS